MKKSISTALRFGVVGLAWCGLSFVVACGAQETSDAGDPSVASEEGEVGEAQQAMQKGEPCNFLNYQFCNPGLTCCGPFIGFGTCRDLTDDPYNCGACGHACGPCPPRTPRPVCSDSMCFCLP